MDRIGGPLIEVLRMELLEYLSSAFSALESPTTGHRSRLSECTLEAVLHIIDALRIPREAADGLPGYLIVGD